MKSPNAVDQPLAPTLAGTRRGRAGDTGALGGAINRISHQGENSAYATERGPVSMN